MATASRPVLRGVIFDMDGTLTKPNLDFTEMYRRVGSPLVARGKCLLASSSEQVAAPKQ